MIRAHTIALDPNNHQKTHLARACGVARFVYNWGLAEWKNQLSVGGNPNASSLERLFNSIKDSQFPFVRQVTKCAPQYAFRHLHKAFRNFFSGRSEYPSFKRKGRRDSFVIANDKVKVAGDRICIPKLGWVRMHESLRYSGKLISVSIRRTATRWFAVVCVEIPDAKPVERAHSSVGIDFGCTNFATISTGERIEGPKPHKIALAKIRRLGKSVSRKVPGSRNSLKASMKLARLHARIANVRRDFIHKFTTNMCRRFSLIGIENLNVSGMTKNHGIARSVLDQSPAEMRRQLEYKCHLHGSKLIVAGRFYASSKICSSCGVKNPSLSWSDRNWVCPNCGANHDRDENASRNLRQTAEQFAGGKPAEPEALVRELDRTKLAALKQELNTRDSTGISG